MKTVTPVFLFKKKYHGFDIAVWFSKYVIDPIIPPFDIISRTILFCRKSTFQQVYRTIFIFKTSVDEVIK